MFNNKEILMTILDQPDTAEAVITSEDFSLEVENRVWSDKDETSYIYHVTKYAEELEIELDDIKRFLSKSLLDKITHEAMTNKLLKTRITTSSLVDF